MELKGERIMITPTRVSYAVLAATIILAGVLHLGAPLLIVLFSYFALRQLYSFTRRKWLALTLFVIVVTGIAAAGVYFTRAAILALPDVADTSIPSASAWAQKRQIDLPFSDFESLRQVVIGALGEEANYHDLPQTFKITEGQVYLPLLSPCAGRRYGRICHV